MSVAEDSVLSESTPTFSGGIKLTELQEILLWELAKKDPECPSIEIIRQAEETEGAIGISIRHVNRLRVRWGCSRRKGRPPGTKTEDKQQCSGDLIRVSDLQFIGVHIFDDWMEQHEGFSEVIIFLERQIKIWRTEHPEKTFPLLYHRQETLLYRFKALFYASLFGIRKLTEYDVREHALMTVIGRGYQSSTLNQYLSQLEWIGVSDALMPALIPSDPGKLCYIDGHMIPFWTGISMHKGKITMLGRIMAGSQAVVAHNEDGYALLAEYYPPDIRLPHTILEYCERIVRATGIELFVIDREVNSVKIAQKFTEKKWGLLSMLDSNEYKGLSDWETDFAGTPGDGSNVYIGKWAILRKDDPGIFVIVEAQGRLLPYRGTPKVLEMLNPLEWPNAYSERTELQENSFRRMISHGALNVNYGIKKIIGPDRHQKRTVEKLDDNLMKVREKVGKKEDALAKQEEKVKESEEKKHGKRLLQRQQRLAVMEKDLKEVKKKECQIREKKDSQGPPRERSDRDFRKQKIMTFRTLLLENALTAFIMSLFGKSDVRVGTETLMSIFFRRGGICLENASEIIYRLNTGGLSTSYREVLKKIAEGLTDMGISRRGKVIRVELREAPS